MSTGVRLLVHIGQGKTGSTSVQRTLEASRDALVAQGIHDFGRMLEHCDTSPPKSWQHADGAVELLHRMDDDRAADEIFDVLSAALDSLDGTGARLSIWSNEALFERRRGVLSALARLRAAGRHVDALVYLRRHDNWARSAYAQWGIRHKSYEGPVMPFRDWIAKRPVHYAGTLEDWNTALGDDLAVRNFETVEDVVGDVLERIGATGITPARLYETPRMDKLVAWAVNNSRSAGEVQPDRFARLLHNAKMAETDAPQLPDPAALLPGADDLRAVREGAAADIARVNAVLSEKGEPPFDDAPGRAPPAPPDTWQLLQFVMDMVFSQQEQIIRLRRRIEDLES